MARELRDRLVTTGFLLLVTITGGALGYFLLGSLAAKDPAWTFGDCLYMTVITLTTVGFGEVIDVGAVAGARPFTMLILVSGLGVSAYFLSTLTAFLVEGALKNVFWRKRMNKAIHSLNGHIILCGGGRVGEHILAEFVRTGRNVVLIDQDEKRIRALQEEYGTFPALPGDPTHGDLLKDAGVERAAGAVSALGDDKDNLCVVVTCKQLNPQIRVLSRCNDRHFATKLELVGADVVIPDFIGGLRMASQMVRPKVVSYLDTMMREKNRVVRIEEIPVQKESRLVGVRVDALDLGRFGNMLLLAVMQADSSFPLYNPKGDYTIGGNDILVFQTEQQALDRFTREYA